MKRLAFILILLFSILLNIKGQEEKRSPYLSKEEFREKQENYLKEKAGLDKEECDVFFPLYFELQDKKRSINERVWSNIKKGKDPKTSDAQYEQIIDNILKDRILSNELEKTYYEKFKKTIPLKKLFKVQHAEMRFHKELLKNINKKPVGHK